MFKAPLVAPPRFRRQRPCPVDLVEIYTPAYYKFKALENYKEARQTTK
jgi:hypothetical protein